MNYFSNWSYDSPHRKWGEVNDALHEQQIKTTRDSKKFIPLPPIKEPLLYTHIAPRQDDFITFSASRPTAERKVKAIKKLGFWRRLGRLFL